MKRFSSILAGSIFLVGFTGCSTNQSITHVGNERIYLSSYGSRTALTSNRTANNNRYRLGAGDALGELVFVNFTQFVADARRDDDYRYGGMIERIATEPGAGE